MGFLHLQPFETGPVRSLQSLRPFLKWESLRDSPKKPVSMAFRLGLRVRYFTCWHPPPAHLSIPEHLCQVTVGSGGACVTRLTLQT